MTTDWEKLADWWSREVATDPAYTEQVLPLLELLLEGTTGPYLDLGCGEGQAMRKLAASGADVVGCDASPTLLARAATAGRVVECTLPDLSWAGSDSFVTAYAVLVLEHLDDLDALFVEVARVVAEGGHLVVVANHPAFTAPGAGPFLDPADGEPMWRWGAYLEPGTTEEPAGDATVTFHHRPLGTLLSVAAASGWSLQRLVEVPVSEHAALRDQLLASQRNIPRMLGVLWQL